MENKAPVYLGLVTAEQLRARRVFQTYTDRTTTVPAAERRRAYNRWVQGGRQGAAPEIEFVANQVTVRSFFWCDDCEEFKHGSFVKSTEGDQRGCVRCYTCWAAKEERNRR